MLRVAQPPDATAPFLPSRRYYGRAERDAVDGCRRGDPFLLEGGHSFGVGQPADAWAAWTGVATTRIGRCNATTPRRARRTVGRTKKTLRFLVCLCMLGPRFVLPLNCLFSLRSGREELYSSFIGRRGSLLRLRLLIRILVVRTHVLVEKVYIPQKRWYDRCCTSLRRNGSFVNRRFRRC